MSKTTASLASRELDRLSVFVHALFWWRQTERLINCLLLSWVTAKLLNQFRLNLNLLLAVIAQSSGQSLVGDVFDVLCKWARGERPQTHRFNTLLAEAGSGEHKDVVTEMVLRSQAQAVYAPDNIGHFGLHLTKYAHFTSPIRRYSDLIVHRALIRAMQLGPDGLSDQNAARVEELAEHLSTTERRSMAAEREATDRYLAHFMADRVGAEFEGRIAGLNKAGLFIKLAETGADGFVPISKLSDEYWGHDERAQALVTRGSGRRYEMGQTVSVRLAEATPLTGGLLLEMLSKPLPKKAGSKAPTARSPRKGGKKMGKAEKHRRRKLKK